MKRLAIIAAAGLAMGAVSAALITPRASPGRRAALAIADGQSRAAAEDEAGYRWAERRAIDQVSDCPAYTANFTAGCRAWAQDEQPKRLDPTAPGWPPPR